MPTRIDEILHKVEVGGVDITAACTESRIRLGFKLKISECELDLIALDSAITHWSPVVVHAGLHSTGGDTASDIAGEPDGILRFVGFVLPFDYGSWPGRITLQCRGPLVLADRLKVQTDTEALHVALSDPLAVPSDYTAPGIDLSLNPDTLAPWTDSDMVTWVLTECGLASFLGTIGGTGHILGSLAFDQFVWRRDQSALDWISSLEECTLGFRTFEKLGGEIVRVNASPRAPFPPTVSITLTEGLDVGFDDEPASFTRNGDEVVNRAVVEGYDSGGGAEVAVVFSGATVLPPGISMVTIPFSSGMIENSFSADGGDGLACDEVGNWLLDERIDAAIDATVPTWRDAAFSPGMVCYLNAPAGEVNQSMWLQGVSIKTNGTSFTQIVELHDRAQRDRSGELGSSSLPLGLG